MLEGFRAEAGCFDFSRGIASSVQVVSHKGPSEDKVQSRGWAPLKRAPSCLEYRAKSVYYAIFLAKPGSDSVSTTDGLKYFQKNKDFAEALARAAMPESILIHFPSCQKS